MRESSKAAVAAAARFESTALDTFVCKSTEITDISYVYNARRKAEKGPRQNGSIAVANNDGGSNEDMICHIPL